MHITTKLFALANLTYDAKNGIGNVPFNQEIDYRGFRVQMTPKQFIQLAAPITPDRENIDYIKAALQAGKPLGQPFLDVYFDPKRKKPPRVTSHEGRHRMYAIKELYGNIPVEVHIFCVGLRAHNITPEMKEQLRMSIVPEGKKQPISGPHFEL